MRLALLAAIVALLAFGPAAAQEATVEAATIEVSGTQTRIAFDLSSPVEPLNIFTLAADAGRPYRVVIDLPEVNWAVEGGTTLAGTGLVQQVRYGRNRPGQSRIVLDLIAPVTILEQEVTGTLTSTVPQIVMNLVPANEAAFNASSGFPERQVEAETPPSESGGTFENIEDVLASLG